MKESGKKAALYELLEQHQKANSRVLPVDKFSSPDEVACEHVKSKQVVDKRDQVFPGDAADAEAMEVETTKANWAPIRQSSWLKRNLFVHLC